MVFWKRFWPLVFFFLVAACFFSPSFSKGWLPFPGDLLISQYAPWNAYSFLGYGPGGVPHKAQGIDVVRMFFPWKYFSIANLKSGQLPLWNPYNFAGNPHLANFQTGIFYPLNILFFIFPFNVAWTIFILLQPLLAACFTYLFVQELKISRLGSLLAGLAFAFSLYFTVWLEWGNIGHALLWLPLSLFLIERLIKQPRPEWFVLLSLGLTFSILAGYIQVTIYLFLIVLAYSFYRRRLFRTVLIVSLTACLLCSVQLLPTLEIFLQSARTAYPADKINELLLPPVHLLTVFVPDFFGNPASRNYWLTGTYIERVTYFGVLPLFFIFLAIFYIRKQKMISFFLGLAVVVLIFTLNLPPARFFYGLKIPVISTTVPTRALYLFTFPLAVLAGFGLDCWLKTKKKKVFLRPLFLFGAVYLFLWLATFLAPSFSPHAWWLDHLLISQRNLFLPTAFIGAGALLLLASPWLSKKLIFLGIIAITVFDLYFYFEKITPFSPSEFVYPQTPVMEFIQKKAGINRFWGYGTGYIDSNFSTYNQIFSPDGYDPLFIRRYGELLAASRNKGQIPDKIPRADVYIEKGYGPEVLEEDFYRRRILNLLGVKYILSKNTHPGTFSKERYQLVWEQWPWQIYENKEALPRIFLAGNYRFESEKQKIIDFIFDSKFAMQEELILEEDIGVNLDPEAEGEAELISYQPNRVVIKTRATGNQLLFVSDNFYSGWRAFIRQSARPSNAEQAKIYRANYSFRAVFVPAGEHQISFVYQPWSFKIGVLVSLVGLLLLAAIIKSHLWL